MTKNNPFNLRTIALMASWTFVGALTAGQNLDIRAYKTRLSEVMGQIGEKSNKKIKLATDANPLISFGSKDTDLEGTLKKIENLYGFQFEVNGDEIIVKDKGKKTGGRGLASVDDDDDTKKGDLTPSEMRTNGYRYRTLAMNSIDPTKAIARIKTIMGDEAKYIEADDKNKSIVIYSDDQTFRLVRQIIEDVDVAPPQILLSTKVLQATTTFSNSIGLQLSRDNGKNGILKTASNFGGTNLTGSYTFGIIDSIGLDAAITAGESQGVAKVISNPQMVTSDNVAASLNSGITINVRVGSVGTTPTGSSTGVVAGGLEKVNAGLQVEITPKVLRDGKIGLKISIDDSSPDTGSTVDGIPSINSTAVKTEMIVRQGQTAALAGIYKTTRDNKQDGVPLFQNVPIFGALFRGTAKSDNRQEVMAFITPTLIEQVLDRINFDPIKKESSAALELEDK